MPSGYFSYDPHDLLFLFSKGANYGVRLWVQIVVSNLQTLRRPLRRSWLTFFTTAMTISLNSATSKNQCLDFVQRHDAFFSRSLYVYLDHEL